MLSWKKLPAEYYKILKRPPQRLFNIKINSEPYVIWHKFSFSDGLKYKKDKKNTRIIHFQIFLFLFEFFIFWINKLAGRFWGGSINQSKHFRWSPRIWQFECIHFHDLMWTLYQVHCRNIYLSSFYVYLAARASLLSACEREERKYSPKNPRSLNMFVDQPVTWIGWAPGKVSNLQTDCCKELWAQAWE